MSVTLIAVTGILVGFLCLVIGFFMEDARHEDARSKTPRSLKKKIIAPRRRAA